MRVICSVILLLAVAACGAGGAPMRPEAHGRVSVSNHGVKTQGDISATNGHLTIGVGF